MPDTSSSASFSKATHFLSASSCFFGNLPWLLHSCEVSILWPPHVSGQRSCLFCLCRSMLSSPVLSRLLWVCTSINHVFLPHLLYVNSCICTAVLSVANIVKVGLPCSTYQVPNARDRHVYGALWLTSISLQVVIHILRSHAVLILKSPLNKDTSWISRKH